MVVMRTTATLRFVKDSNPSQEIKVTSRSVLGLRGCINAAREKLDRIGWATRKDLVLCYVMNKYEEVYKR